MEMPELRANSKFMLKAQRSGTPAPQRKYGDAMNAQAVRAAALCAAFAAALAASPARAGDDGQASLITGLGTTFGLIHQDDPQIDFRERAKLVVPPKKTLPPPVASNRDAAWPVDVETARAKQRKHMEDAEPSAFQRANRGWKLFNPGDDVKVTTSSMDPAGPSCRVPDPKTGECPDAPHMQMEWNPMSWVGLQKRPPTVLGPEPERQSLVDPPKGYRAPAEGVGAKIDNN